MAWTSPLACLARLVTVLVMIMTTIMAMMMNMMIMLMMRRMARMVVGVDELAKSWKIKETRMTRTLISYLHPGEEAGDLQELHPRCRGRSRHHPRHRRGLRRHCLQQWICPWWWNTTTNIKGDFCPPSFRSNLTPLCLGYCRIRKYVQARSTPLPSLRCCVWFAREDTYSLPWRLQMIRTRWQQ